jgi:hypothetical protein
MTPLVAAAITATRHSPTAGIGPTCERGDDKSALPAAGGQHQHVSKWYQQRSGSLGGVEQTGVRRCIFHAEAIRAFDTKEDCNSKEAMQASLRGTFRLKGHGIAA